MSRGQCPVLSPQDRLDGVRIERVRGAANLMRKLARDKRLVTSIDVAHGADQAVDKHGRFRQAPVGRARFRISRTS